MKRTLKVTALLLLLTFAAVTSIWPCKASFPSLMLYAQDGGGGSGAGADCVCYQGGPQHLGDHNSDACNGQCDWERTGTYMGCGVMWLFPCSGTWTTPHNN